MALGELLNPELTKAHHDGGHQSFPLEACPVCQYEINEAGEKWGRVQQHVLNLLDNLKELTTDLRYITQEVEQLKAEVLAARKPEHIRQLTLEGNFNG